jgi:sugar/nucleoside kinase (ribokinase family)
MSAQVHVVGYFSIDRIDAGGAVVDGVPGGAALYAALAANAAGASVVLHANAGEDFRDEWLAQLAARGIDLSGVARAQGPTRRARLDYHADDRRVSGHHGEAAWWERTRDLAPTPPKAPAAADVVALMAVPGAVADAALAAAGRASARVTMDTSAAFAGRERNGLLARAAAVHAFAPSVEETRLLLPGLGDDDAALRLAGAGCNVLHKRGPEGAFAVRARAAAGTRLPAPRAEPRDPTGAGDSVVGALAVGIAAGDDFVAAAGAALAYGARCVGGLGPAAFGFDFGGSPSP